jgi:transcription elongation factor Elf1
MTLVKYPIKENRRAPRSFKCSGCKAKIVRGSIYVKTNSGRYCVSCGSKLPSVEQVENALTPKHKQ